MKGFVPTPESTVDLMVAKLFAQRPPASRDCVLDPGSGRGAFVDGVLRYCSTRALPLPTIVAVESDPAHIAHLRERFGGTESVVIREADFLTMPVEHFDYVIGNPPYVSISGLTEEEKAQYRRRFETASGRFDLYILFFEKAMQVLRHGGRLVFITPEKYLYVKTAAPLRQLLSSFHISELHLLPEDTFPNRVTYPLVSVIDARRPQRSLTVTERSGRVRRISGPLPASSWLPLVRSASQPSGAPTLLDISRRVSCGVATGADSVYVLKKDRVKAELAPFAYPTLSGREVIDSNLPGVTRSMLVPYRSNGALLREDELGSLGDYLRAPERQTRLLGRTCVRSKPWYAFHENPPLPELLRPKVLCKDIGAEPTFVLDEEGGIVPRHSLYYIVPRDPRVLPELTEFLNSMHVRRWLRDHCQRAAKGYLRVQSHVLKMIPLPPSLHPEPPQLNLLGAGLGSNGASEHTI